MSEDPEPAPVEEEVVYEFDEAGFEKSMSRDEHALTEDVNLVTKGIVGVLMFFGKYWVVIKARQLRAKLMFWAPKAREPHYSDQYTRRR